MLERFEIMTDTHATGVMTFAFKGTGVRFVVYGTVHYQMNFISVQSADQVL